jgi:tetratricopeptide (TPR) repeat protein
MQIRIDLARNLERIGSAQLAAGQLGAAVDSLTRSAFDGENLVAADPTSARARRDLAVTYDRLSLAHQQAGNARLALVASSRAFTMCRELAAQDPEGGQAQRELALQYGKWGDAVAKFGHRTVALIVWCKSFDLSQKLAGLGSDNTQAQEDLAIAWERLAQAFEAARLPEAQAEAEQKALVIREKLAAEHPADPASHRGLILSRLRLGDLEFDRGIYDKALAQYKMAGTIAERFPGSVVLARERATIATKLDLVTAVKMGRSDPQGMIRAYKDKPEVSLRVLAMLVDLRVREKAPVEMERVADVLVANALDRPEELYHVAIAFASVALKARNPNEQKRLAGRALQVLNQAVEAGLQNADRLQDHRWDVVRDRTEFQAELAKLQARSTLIPPPRLVTPAEPPPGQ